MLRFMTQLGADVAGRPPTRAGIPWPVFAVTVAGAFMVALDLSIVNVAFPSIERSFPDASTATLSWVLAAYSVVFGALLLGAGRIADRSGRRRSSSAASAVFTLGSLLCGIAPSRRAADRRPGRAGGRRRAADAGLAGAAARRHRPGGPAAGRRHVGRHLRPRRRHRPVARLACSSTPAGGAGPSSSTCRSPPLAARRAPGAGAGVDDRRPASPTSSASACSPPPSPRRPRHHAGRATGAGRARRVLGSFAVAVGARPGSCCARGRTTTRRPSTSAVPDPHRRARQRRHRRLRRRLLRHAARQRAVPHHGLGLLDARGRPGHHARPARGRRLLPVRAARLAARVGYGPVLVAGGLTFARPVLVRHARARRARTTSPAGCRPASSAASASRSPSRC